MPKVRQPHQDTTGTCRSQNACSPPLPAGGSHTALQPPCLPAETHPLSRLKPELNNPPPTRLHPASPLICSENLSPGKPTFGPSLLPRMPTRWAYTTGGHRTPGLRAPAQMSPEGRGPGSSEWSMLSPSAPSPSAQPPGSGTSCWLSSFRLKLRKQTSSQSHSSS